MPNLEYSVRFVLASDSTSEIDQALAKMRDTGSTITVKVNADVSSFNAEMSKVNAEIQKAEASNEKLSRSAQKGSGLFRIYGKEIRQALNEFRATGNLDGANARLAEIKGNVDAFGSSLERSGQNMQEYFTLTNQLSSATNSLNSAYGNSTVAVNTSEVAQKSLNEEVRKSADIIRRNAQARAFDARQVKVSAQEVRDSVTGQIALLRRLSVQGRGTTEEISIAFNRIARTEQELTVTTEDLTQAFLRQQKVVEGSRMSFKNKQLSLNQLKVAEEQTAQSMRKTTSGLAQQENQVGDVSYAMVSFTRLLEDMPYGFRGFANNIQPTVYGLIQLNDKTSAAAAEFRKMHNKEMPLAQRAMINFKSALSSPINQLLLLTSVIAVAGTMIERYAEQNKKAEGAAKSLSDKYLALYDAVQLTNSVLSFNYDEKITDLEVYKNATADVVQGIEEEVKALEDKQRAESGGRGEGGAEINQIKEALKVERERLSIAKKLLSENEDKVKTLRLEKSVQDEILNSERSRQAIYLAQLRIRDDSDAKQLAQLQDEVKIEKVRQASGDEAAVREKHRLAIERLKNDELATANGLWLINLQLEMDLLRLNKDKKKETKEIRNEYDGILLSLQRQLEDEKVMSDQAKLRVGREREITDLHKTIAARRREGEEISFEQETKLYDAIEARYDLIEAREERARRRTIQSYGEQNVLLGAQNVVLDTLLKGEFARAEVLEFGLTDLQYQNDLAELNYEISQKTFDTDEEALEYQRLRVSLLEQEYQIKLKNQVLSARSEVTSFLAPELSPIDQIIANRDKARTASDISFLAEKASIEQQYADGTIEREQALTAMYARQEAERVAIALKGTTAIQDIKSKGYIEGSMIIVGALEQLNQSSEATSKKAFDRQKAISAGLATINTLLAITQVLSDKTIPSTFLKYAQAGAIATIGFAQVRKIQSAQYGGSTSGVGAPAISEGFVESDVQARQGVIGTMNNSLPQMIVNVTGTVDKEGIAWAVMQGTDQINSRGIVLQ